MNAQFENNLDWRLLASASLFMVLAAFLGDHAIGQLVDESQQELMTASTVVITEAVDRAECI